MTLTFVNRGSAANLLQRGRVALGAILFCLTALIVTSSAASARPSHHAKRYQTHHVKHAKFMKHRVAYRSRHARHYVRGRIARMQNFYDANASMGSTAQGYSGGGGLVDQARSYLGGNPTGRGRLWCARFMNMVLEKSGYRGTGSDMARSFANYGSRVSGPQVGAIAVMSRGKRGGHVGIVSGMDASGNPIVISGNNGNRVREAPISSGRIYAYVMPN